MVAGAARGNNGLSAANLRGQGAAATLVLLNGRRIAAHGLNGGIVDLQSIPMGAVERVEILKGRASAICPGTDAIGGVVDFDPRRKLGAGGAGLTDVTEAGGGNITRFSRSRAASATWRRTRLNLLVSLAHSRTRSCAGRCPESAEPVSSGGGCLSPGCEHPGCLASEQ